ncbi:hypothetical protein A3D00_00165 [Candidatus Woesebacteria bacterium RIFCSPHIGHO2_02_FULL_38_9]|nr:MAG: hypothetical protein A3D00_00165 [Candidatus Woesebacteria bacterium RIFCSPHIGHO2_02_FULL_38_9]
MVTMTFPEDIKEAVKKCPLIIGAGPSAWPRIIPGLFFPKYKIVCYVDCLDNHFIRELGIDVFSIKEKDPYFEISPESPGRILDNDLSLKYLHSLKEPFAFLVYKSCLSLENLCDREGWKFLGNSRSLGENFENKKNFKEIIKEVGLEPIPGESIPIENLTEEKLGLYQKTFGQEKLVIQLAEMTYGGGSGTVFIDDPRDLISFNEKVLKIRKSLEGKKKKIETVNVAPYITGISSSIACCATKYGVLVGPIQTQIIDIAEVGTQLPGRNGNFAGHDWSFKHHPEKVQTEATKIAQRFGEYIYNKGYKGIFGLDLIIDEKGYVWPVECNPRYTDAFPLISMLQMEKGLVPFDVFHCLEHLGADYDIDVVKMNRDYQQKFNASQIIIHSQVDEASVALGSLLPGIYKMREKKLEYLRPGIMFSDLKRQDEYLFTERVPDKPNRVCYPKGRIFRVIKRGGILENEKSLKRNASAIIERIYKDLKIIPAHNGLLESYGLKTLFTYKLTGAAEDPQIKNVDVVNVLNPVKDGFRRPYKITWRKSLTSDPVITQIRSKRARKQIKSDIDKITGLGIKIITVSGISEKLFSQWIRLYKKIISAKKLGFVVIGKDWLTKKRKKGKKTGAVLAVKENKIIGGDIFFEVNKILGVGYGIAEKIPELSGGLGLLLDYYFLEYAQSLGYKEVSFGQDTNLYGHDLSIGLLTYKSKLGLIPKPSLKTYWVSTYFLNFEKFEGPLMFFTGKNGNLELNIITDDGKVEEMQKYLPLNISAVNFYKRSEIEARHKKLLLQNLFS